tara:strand:- start:1037 stop:1321 length:285 start_codon:yes stop_codon:yes gene_type:complete
MSALLILKEKRVTKVPNGPKENRNRQLKLSRPVIEPTHGGVAANLLHHLAEDVVVGTITIIGVNGSIVSNVCQVLYSDTLSDKHGKKTRMPILP